MKTNQNTGSYINIYAAILGIFVLILGAWEVGAAGGQDRIQALRERVVLRMYDLGGLTHSLVDFPGPSNASILGDPTKSSVVFGCFGAPSSGELTLQSIAQMIQNRVHPESWDANLGTSIEERAGRLVIMQVPEVHRAINALLKTFLENNYKQLVVQCLLVDLKPEALLPFLGKAGRSFSKEVIQAAIVRGQVRGMPQVVAQNTQRVHVFSGTEQAALVDAEVGDAPAPIVKTFVEGVGLEVQPILSDDERFVDLDLRLFVTEDLQLREGARVTTTAEVSPSVDWAPVLKMFNDGREKQKQKATAKDAKGQPEGQKIKKVNNNEGHVKKLKPPTGGKIEVPNRPVSIKSSRSGNPPPRMAGASRLEATYALQAASMNERTIKQSLTCQTGQWALAGFLPQGGAKKGAEEDEVTLTTAVFVLVDLTNE